MLIKDISWIARKTQGLFKEISPIAKERLRKVEAFNRLRNEKCSDSAILLALQVSRATVFRWKKKLKLEGLLGLEPKSTRPRRLRKSFLREQIRPRVLALTKQYPLWGPQKIGPLLRKENVQASNSTIARVMKTIPLTPEKKLAAKKLKRRRVFDGKHAKRWKYGMMANTPGELIQIDHMTVTVCPGKTVKHFQATCPVSKITVADVCFSASSAASTRFLRKVEQELPFDIKSIQVDGGSEFMKDFEALCREKGFPLFVLPPKSPKYNGCVERRNRTLREEFYALYQGEGHLEDVRKNLDEYLRVYNNIRPHRSIGNMTPNEYLHEHWQETKKSQML